jgi:hypothetical protein
MLKMDVILSYIFNETDFQLGKSSSYLTRYEALTSVNVKSCVFGNSLDQWFSTCGTRTPWGYAVRAQKSLDLVTKSLSCESTLAR